MNLLQNKYFKIVTISLLLLGAGYGIGRFAQPTKVITKTEIKEVIKEVKVVEQHNNVVTVTHTVTAPNGTTTTDTTTHDTTTVDSNTHTDTTIVAKKETITIRDIGLSAQALVLMKTNDFNNREYGILIKKRIIGNISGSILATDKRTIGIALGFDF